MILNPILAGQQPIVAYTDHEIGTWTYQPLTGRLSGCPSFAALLNVPQHQAFYLHYLVSLTEPTGRRYVLEAINTARRTGVISMEVALPFNNGLNYRWLRITGRMQHDGVFSGVAENITGLKNRDLEKDDFVALFNHEIRSPLSTITLYAQLMARQAKKHNDPLMMMCSEKAQEQITAMSNLASTYLDASAIEWGSIKLKKDWFNLHTYLKSFVDDYSQLHPHFYFKLIGDPRVRVYADKDRITQVINNLITNAIKYSPASGRITLRYQADNDWVTISVVDNGNGIAVADQTKLFQRHYRTTNAADGKKQGYGLGLFLVRKIVELHKGTVGVFSRLHHGSEFYFKLPA